MRPAARRYAVCCTSDQVTLSQVSPLANRKASASGVLATRSRKRCPTEGARFSISVASIVSAEADRGWCRVGVDMTFLGSGTAGWDYPRDSAMVAHLQGEITGESDRKASGPGPPSGAGRLRSA